MSARLLSDSVRTRLIYSTVSVCLLAVIATASEGSPFTGATKRVVCPVYGVGTTTLIAMVRIQSTHTEYQRRGFLRIGALPMLVAEQVQIEVHEVRAAEGLFAGLPEWLRAPGKGRAVELRDLKIFGREKPAHCWLSAARVRFASHGQWELLSGEVREPGQAPKPYTRAWLQVAGAHAGQLTLPDGRTLDVFFRTEAGVAPANSAAFLSVAPATEKERLMYPQFNFSQSPFKNVPNITP